VEGEGDAATLRLGQSRSDTKTIGQDFGSGGIYNPPPIEAPLGAVASASAGAIFLRPESEQIVASKLFYFRTLLERLLKTNRYKLATLSHRDVIVCIDTS
jgi:hypothetical protein